MLIGAIETFVYTARDYRDRVISISDAEQLKIIFRRPDQSVFIRDAVLATNGIDGKLKYTTTSTDLDVYGKWQWQPYIKKPTSEWSGDIYSFVVILGDE